jgi:DNA-binding NtrC family response regulator
VSDVLATEHLLPILQADGQEVPLSASAQNPFAGFDRMPSFRQAAQLLVEEALTRAGGNQTLAARILGISQPALSKRMKLMRADDNQRTWP